MLLAADTPIPTGDTAWLLTSAALVVFMTPGLAFFYGGMDRAKNVLNMMMMSFGSLALVGVLWVIYGYSMAFGKDIGGAGILGNPFSAFGLQGLITDAGTSANNQPAPTLAFVAFQAAFAILTIALVSGAVADRVPFGTWMAFTALWVTFVYFPVCHWVFDLNNGWIASKLGAIDFAGGTAVHINAAAGALAFTLVLRKRKGFPQSVPRPHNLPFVLLGAAILWFGWFGFNAGSETAADGVASLAFVNTLVAPCAAILGWLVVEKIRDGHSTSLGAASGAVAGLVGITPACAAITPMWAIVLGIAVGVICCLACSLKFRFGYDDSLDVVGVHGVGGLTGTLLIGLFASTAGGGDGGLFYGNGFSQLGKQAVAAFTVMIYSFVVSYIIALILKATMKFRVSEDVELEGIDINVHAEQGYDWSSLPGTLGLSDSMTTKGDK